MNHTNAKELLAKRDSKKLANNTYLKRRENGDIAVMLHQTDIITLKPDYAVLNSGGWRTVTTKARLNAYSLAGISQKQSVWYLHDGSAYYDGVKVNYDGQVLTPIPASDTEQATKALKKNIKQYVDGFITHIQAGKLDQPSAGDCWLCLSTIGGATRDSQAHLLEHISENYYVPSLLLNAIKAKKYASPETIFWMIQRREHWLVRRILTDYLFNNLREA